MARSRVQLDWKGDELLATIQGNIDNAMFAAGEILLADATGRAPEKTGDLKSSGYVATQSQSTYTPGPKNEREVKPRPKEAVVGFSAFYGRFLEQGTRKMGARPFMRPALDANRENLAQEAIKKLREGTK